MPKLILIITQKISISIIYGKYLITLEELSHTHTEKKGKQVRGKEIAKKSRSFEKNTNL